MEGVIQPAATAFVALQVLSVTVYVFLATYVASDRSSRRSDWPFVGFCLIQAFDAVSYVLLNTPDWPAGALLLLRVRSAAAPLALALFLHMALGSLSGRHAEVARHVVVLAYVTSGLGAISVLSPNGVLIGAGSTGLPGVIIVRPVVNLAGHALASAYAAVNFVVTAALVVHALFQADNTRSRSDARLLLTPAIFLMLSMLVRVPGLSLVDSPIPYLSVASAIALRALSLAAGILLADSVLRFGAPAGRPLVRDQSSSLVTVMGVAVLAGVPMALDPQQSAAPANLIIPGATGLVAGLILSRPEWIRLAQRVVLRRPESTETFANSLGRAWAALAAEGGSRFMVAGPKQMLRSELSAAYIQILERADRPGTSAGMIFEGDRGRPTIRVPSRNVEWPLTESRLRAGDLQGLPGPASLILPIRHEGEVAGLLVIGEPERGGVYGRGETVQAEMLASFLSSMLAAGVPLVDRAESASKWHHTAGEMKVVPAIRAFGRLEIIGVAEAADGAIPLRARQLLALLVAAYPEPVTAERLMGWLWPEANPEHARNSLYVAIHALRRALEPSAAAGLPSRYVLHEGHVYRLHLDDSVWVDIREFQNAYHRGRQNAQRGNPLAAVRDFRMALTLYRGPLLAEAALDLLTDVEPLRQHLRLQCGEMAGFVARQLGEQGRWAEARETILALRAADPADETLLELEGQLA
ncbi:MAG TPA: BTAD domain-containing putative transcriptional regulator, partial [Anaerolineales bacterium]|nr:BTAD domain-containing putative transcriptional regulator [Anaerolineales bacterium]